MPLLALTAPFLLFPGRAAPWLAALLLLPPLGRWLATGRPSRPAGMNGPALVLLAMAGIGYAVSTDRGLSWTRLWGLALQVAIYFALLNAIHERRALLWAGRSLILLTAGIALAGLFGTDWSYVRLIALPELYEAIPRLIRGLPGSGVPRQSDLFHARQVGGTLAMMLPLSLVMAAGAEARGWRAVAALTAALGLVVLLLTQAPMGLLGLLAGLWLWLLVTRRRLALALTLLLAIGGVAALWLAGPARLALALLDPAAPLSAGIVLRLDMWSRALAMIRDMPLSGIGLNTYPVVLSHFYPGYALGPEVHAHNLALQTALDLGLPGLIAFAWLLVAFTRTATRAFRRTADPALRGLLLGLTAGVLAYVAGGLLDALVLGGKPVAALWAMLGVVAAADHLAGPATPAARPPGRLPPGRVWAAALVALTILVCALAPAIPLGNLGAALAQPLVVGARRGEPLPPRQAERAAWALEEALRRAPARAELAGTRGSLRAWQGRHAAALDALAAQVAADGPAAMARHAPFRQWRRHLAGEPAPPPWTEVAHLYQQWATRYPERAEPAVLLAVAWGDYLADPARATNAVEAARARGARPAGLLRAVGR